MNTVDGKKKIKTTIQNGVTSMKRYLHYLIRQSMNENYVAKQIYSMRVE